MVRGTDDPRNRNGRGAPAVAFDSSMASRPLPGDVMCFCKHKQYSPKQRARISHNLVLPCAHKNFQRAAAGRNRAGTDQTRCESDSRPSAAAPHRTCRHAQPARGCGWVQPSAGGWPGAHPRKTCSWRSACCLLCLEATAQRRCTVCWCKMAKGRAQKHHRELSSTNPHSATHHSPVLSDARPAAKSHLRQEKISEQSA